MHLRSVAGGWRREDAADLIAELVKRDRTHLLTKADLDAATLLLRTELEATGRQLRTELESAVNLVRAEVDKAVALLDHRVSTLEQ